MYKYKLSIIVPIREGVEVSWLNELLKVKGDCQFILVFPPGDSFFSSGDKRLFQIVCPLRGELIKRITALLNAQGEYVLSINCDEYIHPEILDITESYFQRYPDSYFFRLKQVNFPYSKAPIDESWLSCTDIEKVPVGNPKKTIDKNVLKIEREIPIAPLGNPVRISGLFNGRKDHHGPHQENFDKKVWKNSLVQETLKKNVCEFNLFGPFKYVPFWTADRFMGLSVQANFFEADKVIGHCLAEPEQLRTEDNPPDQPRNNRRYVLAEILLLKMFSEFGYFWNLVFFDRGGILMVWFPRDSIKNFLGTLRSQKSEAS